MRWEGDKGGKAPARNRGPLDADREARVLRDWADGWSCTDISVRQGDITTRNTAMGIVHRSRGKVAEKAKRHHAAAAALRYPKGPRRVPRALIEHARRERVVSAKTIATKREKTEPRRVLSLAERREKQAEGREIVAKVELTLIRNRAFVKVEKPWDLFHHLRTAPPFEGPFYENLAT